MKTIDINNKKLILCFVFIIFDIISLLILNNYDYSFIKITKYIFLLDMLIVIARIDYKQKIIPNSLIIILLIAGTIFLLLEIANNLALVKAIVLAYFLGMTIGAVVLILVNFIVKNSIGMGDIKLVAILGFYVGIAKLLDCLIMSLLLTAIAGIVLLAAKKITSKEAIPFAPFLTAGTMLVLFLAI